ncbi:lipid A biosynthesis acyltransferase [Treponema primitia]|uniref:LpxL/LpxP family acyltransferase n=1 Tax=Treponema primitia TaxID=88058 RepID=UPI0002554CC2|nr:lipid A biosynthesis acyltransferase [Treponema primitia]
MKRTYWSEHPGAETAVHWSEQKEQTVGYWHVKLILVIFRICPVIIMRLIAFPVAFFYYVFSKRARDNSRLFLSRVAACYAEDGKPFTLHIFRHILAFALTMIEKVESWGGKVDLSRIHFQDDDIGDLRERLDRGEGAVLICSHLGNSELLRALASFNRTGLSREVPVNGIVDFNVTASFNRMLRELNPDVSLRMVGVNDIGPDTIIMLQERLTAGELVTIAGDRTSANTRNKGFSIPFLNNSAPFTYGSFFMAAILNAPTYFVFAFRQKDISLSSQYDMHVHRSPIRFDCSRREREGRIEELARLFARRLESYCKQHPLQWYNFYDFWANE